MRKKLLRFLRIAPLALLFASVASAQTTGTIIGVVTDASTGKPVPGAVLIASSPNLQGQQTAVTDANGAYRLTLLPPGEYTLLVQLGGFKDAQRSDISVRLDKTIRANLAMVPEAVQMEEQVVRTGAAPVINIGAAESGAVVSREFVANVPVGRTVEAVSTTVPTASSDLYGVGFAGAQSPENAYILDGLNVTDPVYGTFGGNTNTQIVQPSLLTNFIQELDVKTGGFMPEYGRATGGVLNMITKSGSNEFHGSAFGNWTPRNLVQPASTVTGAAGEAVAWRSLPKEGAYDLDLGFEVGGPIQKDKLWFYAGFAPVIAKRTTERFLRTNQMTADLSAEERAKCASTDDLGRCVTADGNFFQDRVAGTSEIVDTGRTTYQAVGKLTYLFDENNNFTLSGFAMPSTTSKFRMNSSPVERTLDTTDDIYDVIGRYAGKFLDKRLVVEATAGYHVSKTVDNPTSEQLNTPRFQFQEDMDARFFEPALRNGACNSLGQCPVFNYSIGGRDYLNNQSSDRLAGRVAAGYLFDGFGSHAAKVGLDIERSNYTIDKDYGGNAWYVVFPSLGRMSLFRGYGQVTGGVDGFAQGLNQYEVFNSIRNTSYTTSTALFAQDSWQLPVANVTVNYGIRWEGQTMKNRDTSSPGFEINNNWAPRVQAIWDFTGTGRGKVAASWGRFFYMIPLDMGDRAFGNESQIRYRLSNACGNLGATYYPANDPNDPLDDGVYNPGNTATFNPGAVFPNNGTNGGCTPLQRAAGASGSAIPWRIAQTGGTTPANPDLQGVYVDQFGGQAEYEVLSDLSVGFEYNGRRQGATIEDMSSDDGNHYYIGNPGRGTFTVDGQTFDQTNVVTFDPATGRDVNIKFPSPERSYDGFTFFLRKNFSRNWLASASYTYSHLRGNLAGPFRPEDGQIDPGITSEYDLASLMANRIGYLPGDQTHQLKLYGSYTFDISSRFRANVGAAYTGVSGQPVNALGAHPDYGDGQAFILQRGSAGRAPFLSTVDVRGGLEYAIKPPYALRFSLDLLNLFNSQEITTVDENYTFDSVQPMAGLKCEAKASNAAQLQSACPDIKYLKTVDGRAVNVNSNWGKALPGTTSYQTPLLVRIGVALTF